MRLIEIVAVLCTVTVASAQDPTAPAASLRKLGTAVEGPVVRVAESMAGAPANYDRDKRGDVPIASQQCTPSSLWTAEADPEDYQIGCKEVEELLRNNSTFAGKGNLRKVYIAQYNGRSVAVKQLINSTPLGLHEHWLEMVASDAVKGRPNVVDMLGFCGTTIVTEAFPQNVGQIVGYAKEPLPMEQVISMSLDAAMGLKALHEASDAPIVHFDVKIDQLLARDDGRVSLSDYNLAYFMGTYPDGSPCPFNLQGFERSQSAFKSPEYIAGEILTEKVDIYRMGVVFAQIVKAGSNDPFYPRRGDPPTFDPTYNQAYVKVVREMLGEVERRPSAAQLVSYLQDIQEELFHTH